MSAIDPRRFGPDDLDAPFWDACSEHRFCVHRCATCDRSYWPASTCIDHGSTAMEWHEASGLGTVHTYTVVHHAYLPEDADRVPYVLAVIRLDEGPFFHSDLVGCAPDEVHVDQRVELVWDDDAVVPIPRFAPTPRAVVPDPHDGTTP